MPATGGRAATLRAGLGQRGGDIRQLRPQGLRAPTPRGRALHMRPRFGPPEGREGPTSDTREGAAVGKDGGGGEYEEFFAEKGRNVHKDT